jgi:hypothetical protein
MAPWFVVWRMDIQWKWRTINLNSVFPDFISSLIWGLCADRFTCCDNFGKKRLITIIDREIYVYFGTYLEDHSMW